MKFHETKPDNRQNFTFYWRRGWEDSISFLLKLVNIAREMSIQARNFALVLMHSLVFFWRAIISSAS